MKKKKEQAPSEFVPATSYGTVNLDGISNTVQLPKVSRCLVSCPDIPMYLLRVGRLTVGMSITNDQPS